MSPRGFTIVELLVVVAIVAVLAAIAIPAVGFGIARADSTKCLGNLRAMGVGLNAWPCRSSRREEKAATKTCP